ncbi:hypothetical protein LguiA_009326 [Lonicera macranthoides]
MCFLTCAALFIFLTALWWSTHLLHRKTCRKQPPGPRGLPIIGNLHILGTLPHRNLRELSKKYGPIMFLHLGNVPTVIISSAQAAELFLKTYDNIFASRPKVQASEYMTYGTKGIAFTEYGPYWRNARKFCTLELLSSKKIEMFAGMRRKELVALVEEFKEAALVHKVVDVSEKVAGIIEDMTCKMIFGRCKYDKFNLKDNLEELFDLSGAFNVGDYIPLLGAFDIQGLTRRMKKTSKTFNKILETIIDEHEKNASKGDPSDMDFIDVMLSLKNKSTKTHDELSSTIGRANIKAIVLDVIAGSLDTSQVTIQWVLSELLRHPRVMKQLQEELKTVVGVDNMVEESDLPKLKYLGMVIKESLRLHPVAPLLIPRESIEDVVIEGYYIPKKSRIFVNCWAIGRDLNEWSENAEEFLPERFIGTNVDLRGHDFKLIPFGSGRRGCPGINLGLINIQLVVAQLVHCFDWELPNGMSPSDLDMSEVFGLTVPRAKHLHAVPTYRL